MPTREQMQRQLRAKEARDAESKRKINTRRNIIIGEYIVKYFPAVLKFRLRRTKAENEKEFSLLAKCLSALAADTYVTQLIEKVLSDNPSQNNL